MNCYYHPDTTAVALCKACNRGLCVDCVVNVEPGSSCAGRCEEEVAAINILLERGKTAYKKTGVAYRRTAVFGLLMGLIFVLIGAIPIAMNFGNRLFWISVVAIGVVYFIWSWLTFKSSREINEVKRTVDKG